MMYVVLFHQILKMFVKKFRSLIRLQFLWNASLFEYRLERFSNLEPALIL